MNVGLPLCPCSQKQTNGLLFQLSVRLTRHTSNQTYADRAEKIRDWSRDVLFTKNWKIADSTEIRYNCQSGGVQQWTVNYGPFINGAAHMCNLLRTR